MCLRQECLVASTTRDARLTSMKLLELWRTPRVFSRGAAQQWLRLHGRRFTRAASVRKDKRNTAAPPDTRCTDKGVQLRARAAYKDLCRLAAQDEASSASTPGTEKRRRTVLGIDRRGHTSTHRV